MAARTKSDKARSVDAAHLRQATDALGQLHGLGNATRRQLCSVVADVDRHDLWAQDGASSTEHWLCLKLDMSRRSAHELAAVARVLDDLPVIAQDFSSGVLSWDKLVILCEIATSETDAELAALVKGMNSTQVAELRERHRRLTLAEAEEIHAKRSFKLSWGPGRRYARFRGQAPAEEAMIISRALDCAMDDLPSPPDGDAYPYAARMFDALITILRTPIAEHGNPDLATVVIEVDADVLAGLKEGGATLDNGAPIHIEAARRLSCDCRPVFTAMRDGDVAGIGRADRNIPRWLRRRLKQRDRCCSYPGCGNTKFLHGHHIAHWPKGGPTQTDNLVLVCPYHHRLVHEKRWSLRGDPDKDDLMWVRPDGSILTTGPPLLRQEIYDRIFPPDVSGPLVA